MSSGAGENKPRPLGARSPKAGNSNSCRRDQHRAALGSDSSNMEFEDSVITRRVSNGGAGTEEFRPGQRMTLHCRHCNRVMADSFSLCGEIACMNLIICLKVTTDVIISNTMETRHKGEMANCIYTSLMCSGCRSPVGKVIHSAPSRWASIRSLFLLHKASISCYILDSRSMVKASMVIFDLKPLGQNMEELMKQFDAQLDQILSLKSRLSDQRSISTLVM